MRDRLERLVKEEGGELIILSKGFFHCLEDYVPQDCKVAWKVDGGFWQVLKFNKKTPIHELAKVMAEGVVKEVKDEDYITKGFKEQANKIEGKTGFYIVIYE